MIWYVFFYCPITNDWISAIIVFSLGLSSEIGVCKLFYLYLYKSHVRDLVAEYLICDSLLIPDSRFEGNILKAMRYVKKRAMIFWILIISNGFVYLTKPLILPGRHLPEDNFILYGLNPALESPNFEISYLLSVAGIITTVYLPSNITAFLIIITGYTEAQILALSKEMLHIWDDAEEYYRKFQIIHKNYEVDKMKRTILNKFVKYRLKDVVKIHTMNIKLINRVESVFRGAIAIEFSILIVSLTAELVGGLQNTYLELPFALMQVAMDCFTGQKVIDACIHFENAVYACKWENFDKSNTATVLVILQNSQKTMTLSAGGMTTLSYPSLMAILKSIYSAFTTLSSAVKKN
ncbi:unnamed protein product, partial [Brenthis ino]